jgi:hypothetical protein
VVDREIPAVAQSHAKQDLAITGDPGRLDVIRRDGDSLGIDAGIAIRGGDSTATLNYQKENPGSPPAPDLPPS